MTKPVDLDDGKDMPQSPLSQNPPMFRVTNVADLIQLGGFNPNIYMAPLPSVMPYQSVNFS